MAKSKIVYSRKKKSLTFFKDGKPIGGMIGRIAQRKFNLLRKNRQNDIELV